MHIVAFGHRQRCGKDTAALLLANYFKFKSNPTLKVEVVGFADKVKEIAHELYGWCGLQQGYFYERPENACLRERPLAGLNLTPRAIWIGIGIGLRASVDPHVWTDYLFNATDHHCDLLIVKDMRFPQEANAILSRGGGLYKIERASVPKIDDGADDPLEGFEHWTQIIHNDGSLEEFKSKIETIGETLQRCSSGC